MLISFILINHQHVRNDCLYLAIIPVQIFHFSSSHHAGPQVSFESEILLPRLRRVHPSHPVMGAIVVQKESHEVTSFFYLFFCCV